MTDDHGIWTGMRGERKNQQNLAVSLDVVPKEKAEFTRAI